MIRRDMAAPVHYSVMKYDRAEQSKVISFSEVSCPNIAQKPHMPASTNFSTMAALVLSAFLLRIYTPWLIQLKWL